jgi:hypothetical protein
MPLCVVLWISVEAWMNLLNYKYSCHHDQIYRQTLSILDTGFGVCVCVCVCVCVSKCGQKETLCRGSRI